jgi:glucose dehydrogenase
MRRALTAVATVVIVLSVAPAAQQNKERTGEGDWPWSGRDPGAQRYSPLTQITPENVTKLEQAWSFDTGATDLQVTPIVVNGLMYLTGGATIFALEPETGRPVWTFDAKTKVARRGVAYWAGDGKVPPRIYSGVGDGRLVALDAITGQPATGFGERGFVDMKESIRGVDGPFMLDSPPVVYRNVVITGGSNNEQQPSVGLYGDIRGWDARTGKLLWSFHAVPRAGEAGVETWEGESWKNRSGTNAWTYMTVDLERGIVFAATGSPTSDFYGADRKGNNLYANSLIALDANTGKLKWFQQLVHHDLWDWDLPAAPALIDVTIGGRKVAAVAQITKMSTLFIFDRISGKPLFGLEERPVPQSELPGEATSATQPFPLQPPPLSRTTFDPATDFYTLTPEHAAYCRDLWDTSKMHARGIFSPPELDRTIVMFPSTLGGGNWSGLSYDPVRGLVFTNIMNLGQVVRMERRTEQVDRLGPYKRSSPWDSAYARFWNPDTRVPCSAPPFGELVAVDVNRASVAWRVPLGVFDDLKTRGFDKTGTPNIGGTIVTASGLIFIAGSIDRRFRAFRAETGELLWETTLDASGHATPMTFMGRDQRQYVVIAAGGDGLLRSTPGRNLVAFALSADVRRARVSQYCSQAGYFRPVSLPKVCTN